MRLDVIDLTEANKILADAGDHYLGEIICSPTYILATPERDAIAAFAPPVAQHFTNKDSKVRGALELNRLWQSELRRGARAEKGPLSDFVRAACGWIEAHTDAPCIFSYTDPAANHSGFIYVMSGFEMLGLSRVTDVWKRREPNGSITILSSPKCYRQYHTKSRENLAGTVEYTCTHKKCATKKHIGPGLELIAKPEKKLFVLPLGGLTVDEIRKRIGGRYARELTAAAPTDTESN